ncbi:hypothetical protein QTJ16_004443 [Diplocarpon rosae]|uniref:Uncharacterized protein n=1 Tax=Diplocarpon rosae TaxID=946125 RepID=A0AAD9SYP8_9HELO|nr:hypothetical protein QTJ16_004443 [Diplocarpon rosae]
MARSSSVRLPAPRIIITEPDGAQLSTPPPWKRRCLAPIWVSQLFGLLLGMAILPYESPPGLSFSTLFLTLANLGNLALVVTPCIEAHRYALGTLTPGFFLRVQRCKAAWVLAGLIVVVVGSQARMSEQSGWSVLRTAVVDVLYLSVSSFCESSLRLPRCVKEELEKVSDF